VVAGSPGNQSRAANLEIKAFDQAANPYLVMAALIFAGLAGLRDGTTLPASIDVDPASLSDEERADRGILALPTTLSEVTDAFEADAVLTQAFGTELAATIVDVRRAEVELFADAKPEDVAAAVRWRH
jgi:glutamine synthetase